MSIESRVDQDFVPEGLTLEAPMPLSELNDQRSSDAVSSTFQALHQANRVRPNSSTFVGDQLRMAPNVLPSTSQATEAALTPEDVTLDAAILLNEPLFAHVADISGAAFPEELLHDFEPLSEVAKKTGQAQVFRVHHESVTKTLQYVSL